MSTENIKTPDTNPLKENMNANNFIQQQNTTPISKNGNKSINSNENINKIQPLDKAKYSVSLGSNIDLEQEKEIEFVKDSGYQINVEICGLRVRMGPFISERKAKSVIKYLKINQNVITSMSIEIRKEWLKNLSMMIEELLD